MTLFNLPAQCLPYLLSYKLSSPEFLLPPIRACVRWKIKHKLGWLFVFIHIMQKKKIQYLIFKCQFIKDFILLFTLSQVSLSSSLPLCYFLQYYRYHCCILAIANAFDNVILLSMLPLPPLQPIVIITTSLALIPPHVCHYH